MGFSVGHVRFPEFKTITFQFGPEPCKQIVAYISAGKIINVKLQLDLRGCFIEQFSPSSGSGDKSSCKVLAMTL